MDVASAVVATGSLIVSIIVAFAAFRSAKAAESSATLAARTLERAAFREIVRTAYDVTAETSRIKALVEELKIEYRTLFTFAGQGGGPGTRHQLYVDDLEKRLAETQRLSQEATSVTADSALLETASERDVTQMLARLDASLSTLRPLRETLGRERIDIGEKNNMYRDRRLSEK